MMDMMMQSEPGAVLILEALMASKSSSLEKGDVRKERLESRMRSEIAPGGISEEERDRID